GRSPVLGAVAHLARRGCRARFPRHSGISAGRGATLGGRGAPPLGLGYIIGLGATAMFTGIVDALGSIDAVHVNNGVELRVKESYKGVKKGESIAVNGACLTVEKVLKGTFT